LRKLEDYDWEIDIEFELEKDLYAKQRVEDTFVKEHEED